MLRTRAGFVLCALLAAAPARAAVLYDGALGTTPDQQGWIYGCDFPTCQATQVASGGVTTLDTMTAGGIHAGYFASVPPLSHRHPLLPVLDRTAGYTIRFDVKVTSEAHASANRAGFSIIVISEDRKGIEIGFWAGEVWAQADQPVFTHAEFALFDTTAGIVRYELCVTGDVYSLLADGAVLLSGALRDYYAADMCNCCQFPVPCPYNYPSHIFLGDDTTSARVRFDLARVEVTTGGGSGTPAIGNTLQMVINANRTDIDLQVTPASPASEYHLYRDATPGAIGVTSFVRSPNPVFPPDTQSLAEPGSFYFSVAGIGACGQEFP